MKKVSVYIARNNKKVKARIFSLPRAVTCPGRTKACIEFCYAQCAEALRPPVLPCRKRNLKASKGASFVEVMVNEIKRMRSKYFRIHESGDFYNQAYLDKWTEIVRQSPHMKFFAFTRSHMLDFSEILKLKNIKIRYSMDITTKKVMKELPKAVADYNKPDGFFSCPGTAKDEGVKCMVECKMCVNSNRDIHFHMHGTKKNKLKKYIQV